MAGMGGKRRTRLSPAQFIRTMSWDLRDKALAVPKLSSDAQLFLAGKMDRLAIIFRV